MGIRYDALIDGLKNVEHDNHIIVDRKADKVQEVSLKRFLLFSNVLVAANIKLRKIGGNIIVKGDNKQEYKDKKAEAKKRLEGEKKLSQLRKFNAIYSAWVKSIKNKSLPDSVKDLKKEQKKLDAVIEKMTLFKEGIGKDKIDLNLFEDVTDIDKSEFQDLNIAINHLKTRREILSSQIAVKEGKALSPEQASRILRIQEHAGPILKDEALNTLKTNLYRDSGKLRALKEEIEKLLVKQNPQLIEGDEGILSKIKEYEVLHDAVENKLNEIAGKGIGERALKTMRELMNDRSLFVTNLLTDTRSSLIAYEAEIAKLSSNGKNENLRAVDVYKKLVFLKKLEKPLLEEAIKVREKERESLYKKIEEEDPKIRVASPSEEVLDAQEDSQKIALMKAHTEEIEKNEGIRDRIIGAARAQVDQQINSDFAFTYDEFKVPDLSVFPLVRAYQNYQEGKNKEAGKEVWRMLRTTDIKVPSLKEFDRISEKVFGEKLDPQIYNELVQDFHVKEGNGQGDFVWFKWVNENNSIPSFEEFKVAFKEKVGIEPLKENYDRLVSHLNEFGKPKVAENVWIHLMDKNKRPPYWNEFQKMFKDILGIEPERKLYKDLVKQNLNEAALRKEHKEKSNQLRAVLRELRDLVPFIKEGETWYAKDKKGIQEKLNEINVELEKINNTLRAKADNANESDPEITRLLKSQQQLIIERELISAFAKNSERVRLYRQAMELNSRVKLLSDLLEEA